MSIKRNIKRNSIQIKLMVFFAILSTVLFITVGLLFFRSTKDAINSSKEKELITLAQETSNKIERYMFERYGDIQVMASSPLLKSDAVDKNLKVDYLNSVRKAYNAYDYILIADTFGNVELYSGELNNDRRYKEVVSGVLSGKTVVSDFIYFEDINSYGVYYAAPILDNQSNIKGAVIERMNFNAILDIVENVKLGEKGYAYLINNKGSNILRPFHESSSVTNVEEKKFSTYYTQHNGKSFLSAMYSVKKYDSQRDNWYVVIEQPIEEAYEVAYRLRTYTAIVLLISIIIVFVLVTLMSMRITRPIKELLKETQIIAEGDMEQNINIVTGDEIGGLAESFNTMLNNLKSMMEQVLKISGEAASIAEIRQYTDKFLENIQSGVITVDNAGKITSFNNAACEILGVNEHNIIGKAINEYVNTSIEPIVNLLDQGIKDNIIYIKHIIKIKNKVNKEIPIIINTSVQKDSNGKLLGVIGVFRSVKEVEKLEESIMRAKNLEALGALAAGVAHEIRNPLTSIKGYAQYIKSELGDNNELTSDVCVIVAEVDRLNHIIERFLAFARPEKLNLELCNINKVVQRVINLINKDDLSKNIDIKINLGELPVASIDFEQMVQVIFNITINAIQAMKKGGILKIETNYISSSEMIEIEVKDTGEGISSENQDKIFEPFFTTKEKGTGLGLAICARIVENHKGVLEVSSIPKFGTIVKIKLPITNK